MESVQPWLHAKQTGYHLYEIILTITITKKN